MPVANVFPALTGGLRSSLPARVLQNYRNATCYANAAIQVLVHLPHVANMPVEEWKLRCGCSRNSTCWLCYLGLRVASSHGDGSEGSKPTWVLKRFHLLDPGSSAEKRNRPTPQDPDQASLVTECITAIHPTAAEFSSCHCAGLQVVLSHRTFRMGDSADFFTAFIEKAHECDCSSAEVSLLTCLTGHTGSSSHIAMTELYCNAQRCMWLPVSQVPVSSRPNQMCSSRCLVHVLQGGKSIVDHLFQSQMVQDVTCPGCSTSLQWSETKAFFMPLINDGMVCSSIQQSLNLLTANDPVHRHCDTCNRYHQQ